MTISVTQETQLSPLSPVPGEQQETACETTSAFSCDIQTLDSQQEALLRACSDLCLSVITNVENALFTTMKTHFSPSASLFTKHASTPQRSFVSSSTASSITKEAPSSPQSTPQSSQDLIPLPEKIFSQASSKPLSLKHLCTTSLPNTSKNTTSLTALLPGPNFTQPHASSSRSSPPPTRLFITVFNKKESHLSEKELTTSSSQSSDASPSSRKESLPFRTLMSPMALFETKAQTEASIKEGRSQDQDDQPQEGDRERNRDHDHSDQHEEKETFAVTLDVPTKKQRNHTPYPEYLPQEVREFALSEAQLSQLLRIRLNHLDILRICAEIMKLMLNSREQDLLERRTTREHFMREAKNIASSFARQAQITKWLGIATATLGIFGAVSPLIGEVGGEGLLNVIRKATGGWQRASSKTFFEGMGKICTSLSELAKVSSTVYDLRANAVRTIAESYKELFRLEHDEMLRSIEELKDHWRNMDNFLLQILQTQHDAVRSLYQ